MAKNYYGSIDLSLLLQAAKEGHSGFIKAGEKQHIYVSVTVWANDNPDKFGSIMSIVVNPKKDSTDKKFYIGNLKEGTGKIEIPVEAKDLPDEDDLPF